MQSTKQGGIAMKLSEKLIELRKANGWSQEDLAEKVDVSRQANFWGGAIVAYIDKALLL